MFSKRYNGSVILLKGANSLIAHKDKIYFDTYGNPNLAKGGSGDVLAGMVGALIAQGYSPIKATITASLAHSFASQNYKGNCFTLSPNRLIEELSRL
jgi:NAD(P)H-hydrate repair Nnr-like enzyme with NAD(P)H-hydrate dehydratase domain